jgi:circadian clock protein KaiC
VTDRVRIEKLSTGVTGLDDALGGGIPELSFTLIAGGPGAGKTTLAHQLMFGMASEARPALYITILGEPPLKMLRYQQQFTFFDAAKIPQCIRFLHLGAELLEHGIDAVLTQIVREVEQTAPKLVFVDSFRAIASKSQDAGQMELQSFVQRLSLHLTSWEATTFLIGEYEESEAESASIFTVADGIVWLSQATSRNSVVRKLQILKLRGQASIPGLHTVKISDSGVRVFPRITSSHRRSAPPSEQRIRRSVGSPELDEMLSGGIPAGYSVLIAGPSGSGKTVLATQFLRAGIAGGERGVLAVFETPPDEYLATAPDGASLTQLVAEGKLSVLYLRPLDLSVDETMDAIASEVQRTDATRVVIDSLMGLELALAPSFREDFRESLYRMVGALTALGVTVVMTAELTNSFFELALSPHEISFLTDGIIVQRYVEMGGELRRLMFVAKLRALPHSKQLRLYDVTRDGIALGERLANYDGVLTGFVRRAPTTDDE